MPHPQSGPIRITTIICAAGSGTRFGRSKGGKLNADIHGEPVLIRAVQAIAQQPEVVGVLVPGPADPHALAEFRDRHGRALGQMGARICAGGVSERYETVKAALECLIDTARADDLPDAVLVHDAARPCTPLSVVRAVIEALANHDAVVPAVPVADTLKRADPIHLPHGVIETIDRHGLFACQTPQGFRLDLLRRAYAQTDLSSTDDAQLVERLGEPVVLVPGDTRNIKITRPQDLELARAIWPTLLG